MDVTWIGRGRPEAGSRRTFMSFACEHCFGSITCSEVRCIASHCRPKTYLLRYIPTYLSKGSNKLV